jgi:peptidoglycan hydrolase-like protein with peptidoglycan-binding domain
MNSFIQKMCVFVFLLNMLSGCDFIYGILQKEGAQEKKILGDVTPSVYNEKVEYAQKLLLVHGFSPGKIDGKLGGKMREAIAKFQTEKGLTVTRFVDDKTWEALNMFTATGLIKDGELQFAVIQKILRDANFYSGKIDGKIGPQATKAIKDFQKAQGLSPDGRIGPKTLSKLNDFLLSQ